MLKKILLGLLALITIFVVGFVILVNVRYDRTFDAPYPDITASTDSAVIARGRYLVLGPAHCPECHAPMSDIAKVLRGEETPLSGGFDFQLPLGIVHAPNITSDEETGIGKYTDGEIARALRYGVKRNGRALIDFMPFYDVSEADLTAIVSYLRTQPAVKNKRPEHEWSFLGKAVLAFLMKPMGDGDVPPAPAADSTAEYGKYLVYSVANCRGCHTARDFKTGAYIGPDLAGGSEFEVINDDGSIVPNKHLVPPNLTPDEETGRLSGWSQKDFIERFRKGRLIPGTPMPWGPFTRMSDMELAAIYKFLQTATPVKNAVALGIQDGAPAE